MRRAGLEEAESGPMARTVPRAEPLPAGRVKPGELPTQELLIAQGPGPPAGARHLPAHPPCRPQAQAQSSGQAEGPGPR